LFSILKEVRLPISKLKWTTAMQRRFAVGPLSTRSWALPEEEFPRFPEFGAGKALKIEQSVLRDMLRKTAYAVSNDETRYVLNGVFMGLKGDKLTVVATDGRRLALMEHDIEIPKGSMRRN
jgi:DNA polymerase III subunit beta